MVSHESFDRKVLFVSLNDGLNLLGHVCMLPVQFASMLEHSHCEKWIHCVVNQMPDPLGAVDVNQTSRKMESDLYQDEKWYYMHNTTDGCGLPTPKGVHRVL